MERSQHAGQPSAVSFLRTASDALLPAEPTGPDPDPLGPNQRDVRLADARGRILVADSMSYCDARVGTSDVVEGCSFAGASTVRAVLPRGVKALIAHDAGVGRGQAGISGLPLCDTFGTPMAAVAGRTASLSNGNSLYDGTISAASEAARALGVELGQPARQAADLLLGARPGRPIADPVDLDLALHELGRVGPGRILARVWLLDLPGRYPDDVFALGTHCASVAADHAFRWDVEGWIADDAGMAKNDNGVAALAVCGDRGMAARDFPRTGDRSLDHREFWPILEAASALRAPLYLHPQSPPTAVRRAYYSGYSEAVDSMFARGGVGWHYDAGVEFLRLMLSGALDRFPDLRIVLGHWGEVILFFLDRIDLLGPLAKLPRRPSEYVRDHVLVTPSGIYSQRYLRWAVEVLGVERILFSTDYPFETGGTGGRARGFLERADLADADREKIVSGNWDRLCARIRRDNPHDRGSTAP